ncbi:MAG: response regulator transcription factor [Gammaproteobacteria bacterium]|nr:MAG: response regulator transcription factor [Gammaproteobacteria bacterium]
MRRCIKVQQPDIVILDLQMPGEHGLELARKLRQDSDVGIIIVTGTGDKVDEIVGLEGGADDYLTKPVEERALLARVRSVLRRVMSSTASSDTSDKSVVKFSDWILDFTAHELKSTTGEEIILTSFEFQLLATLVKNANRVLSRDQIMVSITGRDWVSNDRSVDVLMGKLRKKIERDPHNPSMIKTIRGAGYKFTARVEYS